MPKLKILLFIVLIIFGGFLFVYGGYDDSPGAQGLGLLVAIIGTMSLARMRKRFKAEKNKI
jgi:drug/metabolite transporter (DMT)-like permease